MSGERIALKWIPASVAPITPELNELRGVGELHISNVSSEKLHTPLDNGTMEMKRVIPLLEKL